MLISVSYVFDLSESQQWDEFLQTTQTTTCECKARTEDKFIIYIAGRFKLALTKLGQAVTEAPWPQSR